MNGSKLICILFMYVLISFSIMGCDYFSSISFVDVAKERTKLINGIESYQSIEEFKAYLNKTSLDWKGTANDGLPPGDKRPPYNIYTIEIYNYSHLGITGKLSVTFFNNRLMDTAFFPSQLQKYTDALKSVYHLRFKDDTAMVQPYTKVRILFTHVRWSDSRLKKEFDIWIERYS